ncbi:hypothetical protein SAMN05428959_109195 [Duganella sp. CF517]|uniref:hypothetical protein n=1 Tax=Duganella sp. CF517 TaxID=1881038 RepID=UPI0008C799B0|nr:hypothetical protein [Duganella sp. CF517]SEO54293.1 hypothetical protein SAMN05428959_109195 [Duganella sp. CF517]
MRTKAKVWSGAALVPGLMLSVSLRAAALEMTVCVFDQPFSPLTFPDGCGQSLELLRRASALQPVAIRRLVAPRSQCMNRLRSGQVDAMLAAFTPERATYGAYPMKGAQPDPGRGVGELNFSVSRRRGAAVDWDGQRFIGLGRQPVGAQPDLLHIPMLREMGVVIDSSGSSVDQVFAKLAGKRVAAAVTERDEGAASIARKYRGQIDMLPVPFQKTPVYLLVNQGYYQKHQAQVEAYWQAIAQARHTPGFRRFIAEFPQHQ